MTTTLFPFHESVLDLFEQTSTEATGPAVGSAASESSGGWRSWIAYPILGAALVVAVVAAVTGHLDKVGRVFAFVQRLWSSLKGCLFRRSDGGADGVPMDGRRSSLPPPVGEGRNLSDNEILEARASRTANSLV